jgi:hypothetical protein
LGDLGIIFHLKIIPCPSILGFLVDVYWKLVFATLSNLLFVLVSVEQRRVRNASFVMEAQDEEGCAEYAAKGQENDNSVAENGDAEMIDGDTEENDGNVEMKSGDMEGDVEMEDGDA